MVKNAPRCPISLHSTGLLHDVTIAVLGAETTSRNEPAWRLRVDFGPAANEYWIHQHTGRLLEQRTGTPLSWIRMMARP